MQDDHLPCSAALQTKVPSHRTRCAHRAHPLAKTGRLELSVERVYRGDEPSDDVTGFIASFDGRGKWKGAEEKALTRAAELSQRERCEMDLSPNG